MFVAIISKRREIALDTFEISFLIQDKNFNFQAGQYIEVNLEKLLKYDPKGHMRIFSIASSPNEKGVVSVAFRRSGSGFKESLLNLPINTKVEVSSPLGHFTLPKTTTHPLVFIAGGIGITPFLSMTRFVTEEKLDYKITLLYANREPNTTAYLEELEKLEKVNINFKLKNKFGPLDDNFLLGLKTPGGALWYIAGPPQMVAKTRYILTNMNVNPNIIFTESYIGY